TLPSACVLTPHPGEAARLLGTTTSEIQADRFAAVRALAQKYRAMVVLKGAGSLIADADGRVAACPWGNPGMASGGMGDLLTGVIAGLLAQGLGPWDAACLGVGVHARAGDLAARAGERPCRNLREVCRWICRTRTPRRNSRASLPRRWWTAACCTCVANSARARRPSREHCCVPSAWASGSRVRPTACSNAIW